MDPVRLFLFGGYRNRNPLAYAPIRAALGSRAELVFAPEDAQLLVISHFRDIELFGARIAALLQRFPRLRLVLLSEEPFWDSCWMPDPFTRAQRFATPGGPVDCTVLNHATSAIFRPEKIPYFLLTDPRYIARYRPLMDRNAGWQAQDWHRHFTRVAHDAVFLARNRGGPRLNADFGGDAMRGLSVWRTDLAAACTGTRVLREGIGWGTAPPRQSLPDWHADKLARFDLGVRYMSALENTHQADYVSEKIWDAFAIGAIPLYAAGPGHAVHRLIGSKGWINLFGHLGTVPVLDATDPVDMATATSYAAQQERLARLFSDQGVIAAEYERLCTSLLEELVQIVES